MNRPYEIIRESEIHLDEFIEYQIEFGPTNDYGRMARYNTNAAAVLKCAAILYPTFSLVEDQVVLKDHYSEENWNAWREKHGARESVNVINHVWDGLLGPKWDEGDLDRRAREIPKVELAAGGIDVWLKESREAAVASVYAPDIMEPVSVALRGKTEVPQVDLPESYLKAAGSVAQKRAAEAAEAANRLAGVRTSHRTIS